MRKLEVETAYLQKISKLVVVDANLTTAGTKKNLNEKIATGFWV